MYGQAAACLVMLSGVWPILLDFLLTAGCPCHAKLRLSPCVHREARNADRSTDCV